MVSRDSLENKITCTVCGFTFDKGTKRTCSNCPFHSQDCGFEKCPNCGFDIPVSSKIWDFFVNIKEKLGVGNERKDNTQ